jgi:hypothetical protein
MIVSLPLPEGDASDIMHVHVRWHKPVQTVLRDLRQGCEAGRNVVANPAVEPSLAASAAPAGHQVKTSGPAFACRHDPACAPDTGLAAGQAPSGRDEPWGPSRPRRAAFALVTARFGRPAGTAGPKGDPVKQASIWYVLALRRMSHNAG